MLYLLAIIIVIAVLAGAVLYGAYSWGYVLYMFYDWFVIPVFPFLPDLNYNQAIGLMLVVMLLRGGRYNPDKVDETERQKWEKFAGVILAPWIMLVMGWFIKGLIS